MATATGAGVRAAAVKEPPPPPPGERDQPKASAQALQAALRSAWSGIEYTEGFNFGDLEVAVAPTDVLEACARCKSDASLAFDYLMLLTGTDFETFFEVVYHLYSYRHHHRLTIRTKLEDYEHPSLPSLTTLWPGIDWHERETKEMLGIDFPGHPNLRPLLLDDDVDEMPLRKSHQLVPIYADRPGLVTGLAAPTAISETDAAEAKAATEDEAAIRN